MLHSVRARLTLWYTAILALMLIIFSGISYALLARAIRSATDVSIAATAHEFAAAFSNDGNLRLDFRTSERQIIVFTPDGRVVTSSKLTFSSAERERIGSVVRHGVIGFASVEGGIDGDGIRLFTAPIRAAEARYIVVVAEDLDDQADRLENVAHAVLVGIPLALLVAAAGGYVMARKSLAPVTMMSLKARQISAETLGERIVVGNERDELGFLAITLNDLLGRLQRAFESQRRFMADASHELRTPVAIIQGEADVTLSRHDRSPAEYRESIEVMHNAARKLTRIVNDLFLLARSDAGRYTTRKSRFYLDELVADCVRAMRSVAAAKRIRLTCDAPADAVIFGDEELLHRMLLNLIDNAVKFTPAGGWVRVCAERTSDAYAIRVSDSGAGITPEERPHIFERFYRGGRARREVATPSGAGLGLPIARWIAELHDGTLDLDETNESGTTFIVVLPREIEEESNMNVSQRAVVTLLVFLSLAAVRTSRADDYAVKMQALPGASEAGISMDYIAFDPATHAVWVPAGNTGAVDVVDPAKGTVRQITGFPTAEMGSGERKRIVGPSSVTIGKETIYIGNRGDSSICAINPRTLERGTCHRFDSMPDGIAYVASTNEVWVTTPRDKSIRIVDAKSLEEKSKLTFEGNPEGFAVDGKRGRFYTNLEDKDLTLAIDLKSHKIVATWKSTCGEDGPHGLRLDESRGHLFVACSARAEVLDAAHDGAVLSSIDTGDGVDDIDYSSKSHRLYVGAAKAGQLVIAADDDHGKLSLVAKVPTHLGARNPAVTNDGTVYLAHSGLGKMSDLVVVSGGK
jgi:heavy metal sensor kinase